MEVGVAMKSVRALNRDLRNIIGRIIRDDTRGVNPDPADLEAMKETVGLLIDALKAPDVQPVPPIYECMTHGFRTTHKASLQLHISEPGNHALAVDREGGRS